MTTVLVVGAGLVVLSAAGYAWMISTHRRADAWQQTSHEPQHDLDTLAQLAKERARAEMDARVRRLMREGRR